MNINELKWYWSVVQEMRVRASQDAWSDELGLDLDEVRCFVMHTRQPRLRQRCLAIVTEFEGREKAYADQQTQSWRDRRLATFDEATS